MQDYQTPGIVDRRALSGALGSNGSIRESLSDASIKRNVDRVRRDAYVAPGIIDRKPLSGELITKGGSLRIGD
jgi:hypothetical protein